MRRRRFELGIVEAVIAVAVIVMSVLLFIRSEELTILYPVVFGSAALLAVICLIDAVIQSRNNHTRNSQAVLFGIAAAALAFMTYLTAKVVL
ncbi:MAG: hypothetical protein J6Z23_00950 [Lachnospiraceae bacterium]|nr:hypothetical protein [Lachnospiraceae bacterium]MBP5253946.1 hypothetical protein [Lachnospiraceae bacterium]